MSIGKNGKESDLVKQSTKTPESFKTLCCLVPNTELKEEGMDNDLLNFFESHSACKQDFLDKPTLIAMLHQMIKQITDMNPTIFEHCFKKRSATFRAYEQLPQLLDGNYREDRVCRKVDITIEI
jgi:hypothetical protein